MWTRLSLAAVALAVSIPAQADEVLVLQRGEDRRARDLLYQKLHSIRVDAHFEDATPKELAEYLATASGDVTNFVVSTREDLDPLTLRLKRVRLTTVMDIAQRFSKIRFAFRNGIVRIQHQSEVAEYTSLCRYDVRSATTPIPSFPGPELRLTAPGDEDLVVEDDDDKASASGFTADRLVDLIRTQVLPESWDSNGVEVTQYRGVLWVRQTDRGHRKVEELLRALAVIPTPRRVVLPADKRSAAAASGEKKKED